MKLSIRILLCCCLGLSSAYAQQRGGETKDIKSSGSQAVHKAVAGADTVIRSGADQSVKTLQQEGEQQQNTIKEHTTRQAVKDEIRTTAKETVKLTAPAEAEQIRKDLDGDVSAVKNEAGSAAGQLKGEGKGAASGVKRITKEDVGGALEDNATKLQYDSENPESAPWKQNPLSGKDLKDGQLPGAVPNETLSGKPKAYADKVKNMEAGKISAESLEKRARNTPKLDKFSHAADSISALRDKMEMDNLRQELLGSKKVYSDKYMKKIYDSLGIEKGDSLFKVASSLIKKTETPKEELLQKINSAITGKEAKGVGFDTEKQSLKMADADKLSGLPGQVAGADLSQLKLPDSLLSELSPLSGKQLDSKYLPVIDSMRDVALKLKKQSLDERQVTEDLKRTAMKKKPTFRDKIYFEGIIGFVSDSAFNIVQVSPSLGYHFTDFISLGLGPNLLLQFRDKKLDMMAGFRSFIKAELWKQRLYLQVEDNVGQARIHNESLRMTGHQLLAGGGGLLPISKSLALNLAVLHRLNKDVVSPNRSPWVIRVGISSIKKRKS